MCHFLFFGIAQRYQPLLLEHLAKGGFETEQIRKASITSAFPAGDVVMAVTRGGCSCGLCGQPARDFDESAERLKYAKKGWSHAKIDRAILGKRPSERPEFVAFRDLFAHVVRSAGSGRLLAHWFSGDLETEKVGVRPGSTLHLDDYLARGGTYEDDVVHNVRNG